MREQDFVKKYRGQLNELAALVQQKKDLEKQIELAKAKVLKSMNKFKITSVSTIDMRVTYTPAGTRTSFDSTKFKADHPEVYRLYLKTSSTKEYLTVTLK